MPNYATDPHRVLWLSPGTVAVEPFEPREPGDGEVLVRSEVSLISPGTERAFLLSLDNAKGTFPSTGGYSLVGTVIAQGKGVTKPAVGARIVCASSHASHATVRAERCVEVPSELPSETAAFFNLMAIAMQGIRKARIEIGESVVVFGAGLIGQCAMQLARASGATPVVALDLDAGRREHAAHVSADIAMDPKADGFESSLLDRVRSSANPPNGAPQVVIEATGYPDAILGAMSVAGWMARVVLLGSTRGETERVNFYRDVHKKGLVLLGAHASSIPGSESHPGHWTWVANVQLILRLLAAGRLNVTDLITDRVAAENAPSVYAKIAAWQPSVLGAILNWA